MFDAWLESKYGRVRSKAERKMDKAAVAEHFANSTQRRFPKGHIREYDPDGIYTYRDLNPKYQTTLNPSPKGLSGIQDSRQA